jgi:hypothetical protein
MHYKLEKNNALAIRTKQYTFKLLWVKCVFRPVKLANLGFSHWQKISSRFAPVISNNLGFTT